MLATNAANTCDLTEEYKKAKVKMNQWAKYEYQECIHSVSEYYYWQGVSACKAEGRGINIGGGYQHVAAHTPTRRPKSASSHCEILKIGFEEYKKALDIYVKENNIIKCAISDEVKKN